MKLGQSTEDTTRLCRDDTGSDKWLKHEKRNSRTNTVTTQTSATGIEGRSHMGNIVAGIIHHSY